MPFNGLVTRCSGNIARARARARAPALGKYQTRIPECVYFQ